MTLVCSPGSVAMPTEPELKGPRFWGSLRTLAVRTGVASVTAPAGARADPDGHMMSPADQAGRVCGPEKYQFICSYLHQCPRAQCLLPPSVCVDELSAALLVVNACYAALR